MLATSLDSIRLTDPFSTPGPRIDKPIFTRNMPDIYTSSIENDFVSFDILYNMSAARFGINIPTPVQILG